MTSDMRPRTVDLTPTPPIKLAHVVLKSSNVEALIAFYQSVLSARVVFQNELICFLSYDDEHHRLAIIRVPPAGNGSAAQTGVDHIAFSFRDLDALLGTYLRLKEADILPVRTINHGPTISFYYRDPDGLRVELQVDNFETAGEADEFFHSRDFADNPIGVLLDPERLVADFRAGVPWSELKRRPPLPAGSTIGDMRRERA